MHRQITNMQFAREIVEREVFGPKFGVFDPGLRTMFWRR